MKNNKELYYGLGAVAFVGLCVFFAYKNKKSSSDLSSEVKSEFSGGIGVRTAGASIPAQAPPPSPSNVGGLRIAGAGIPTPSLPPLGGAPMTNPIVNVQNNNSGNGYSGGALTGNNFGHHGIGSRYHHNGWRNNYIVPYGYPVYVGVNDLCYYKDNFGLIQSFYCNNWNYGLADVANVPVTTRYVNVKSTVNPCKKGKCLATKEDGTQFCSSEACKN